MSGKKARSRSPLWRAAAIVEVIVCYMAVLTVISYARGPEHWRPAEPPVLESGAFTSFAGEPAGENGPLPMENGPDGQAVGYEAEADLIGGAALQVSLKVECPAEYAGNTLIVDLYNDQAGYDDPAQESWITLQAGTNQLDLSLDPGASPPERALVRLFTLDSAGYQLEDVTVRQMERTPKVPGSVWIGLALCLALPLFTLAAWTVTEKRKTPPAEPGETA